MLRKIVDGRMASCRGEVRAALYQTHLTVVRLTASVALTVAAPESALAWSSSESVDSV